MIFEVVVLSAVLSENTGIRDEGISISVQSSEPSDVTQVSVIHAAGTEKSPESPAAEQEETNTNVKLPEIAVMEIESREKSEEAVIVILHVNLLLCLI